MATWRRLLLDALTEAGESQFAVESCTLSDGDLDQEFDDMSSTISGAPFTVWTRQRVYFPATYDGQEWVASVARHPDFIPTDHVGGPT